MTIFTPTGSSLNDIFRFISGSPYQYILDGYKYDVEKAKKILNISNNLYGDYWKDYAERAGYRYPINKMASDIGPEDMILIGYDAYNYPFGQMICDLKAESKPTISKEHNLTHYPNGG